MKSSDFDSNLYESCTFAAGGNIADVPHIRKDIRDVLARDLKGLRPSSTSPRCRTIRSAISTPRSPYDINHRASVRFARLAKEAGVGVFCLPPRAAITVWRAMSWSTRPARSTPSRPMAIPRSEPSGISRCWRAMISVRSICARRPPMVFRPAFASTLFSTTWWPGR